MWHVGKKAIRDYLEYPTAQLREEAFAAICRLLSPLPHETEDVEEEDEIEF